MPKFDIEMDFKDGFKEKMTIKAPNEWDANKRRMEIAKILEERHGECTFQITLPAENAQ